MKSLVIGASGQVGKCLMRLLGDDAVGTAHTRATGKLIPLDLADAFEVTNLIRELKPRHIYVPGGVTAVDWCETHEAEARRICVDGSIAVQEAAAAISAATLYFSTDYVFSGKSGPYLETSTPDPISAYGRVKLEAEKALEGARIIRTSMVYSDDPDSRNFHNFVRDTVRSGGVVKAFSDQTGSPTYAPDVAAAAVSYMNAFPHSTLWRGPLHYAGPEVLTRLEFARRVARAYELDEQRIQPVTSEELRLPAPRPGMKGGLWSKLGVAFIQREPMSVDAALSEMSKRNQTRR